jgi:nitroimidazol reductase NimA-like FMN-containing flavoprotein (pyridoxamine 5'-phosphate oxidase superfamily)
LIHVKAPIPPFAFHEAKDRQRRSAMQEKTKAKILRYLADNRIMSVATLRSDGWPQATIVGYASEGLVLYFLCSRDSQKARNLADDDRISLTIGHDTTNPLEIEGLSMAARARQVQNPAEIGHALKLLLDKYPEYRSFPSPDMSGMRVMRVTPTMISVLDYRLGFGHAELVETGLEAAA